MKTGIWQVKTQEFASLQSFKLESDMEAFICDNPSIVGCKRDMIRQLTIGDGKSRIDLIGITEPDAMGVSNLLLFELKNVPVDKSHIEQLQGYLNECKKEENKIKIKTGLNLDEKVVDELIEKPIGILIGPEIAQQTIIETIQLAKSTGIQIIRFAKFVSKSDDKFLVLIEDIVGETIEKANIQRVSPKNLFQNGTISENDVFYFRDDKGNDYKNLIFKVLNKIGPSHSFMINIEEIENRDELEIPKWDYDHYEYEKKKFPIPCTAKTCSIALHKFLNVYDNEELFKKYWQLGEGNFVRKSDGKSLWQIREEYRGNL